jgi:peptidoglycan hydrolase-like protein with peptidoglycan-binding domain
LGNFFASSSSGVSSHSGIDDTAGTIGVYVKRADKAWTAANANPQAVQAELCAFAAWDNAEWHRHPNMLENCARWVAEESAAFGIPIVRLNAAQAQGGGRGVCQHIDLGSWGGGHVDCGNAFPMDEVLAMAGGQPGTAPTPPSQPTQPPKPGGPAPPFPYPSSDYLGQPDPDPHCHSGFYGGVDTTNVRTWQQQMASRGWHIGVDGQYGPQSEDVCRSFQAEKGLSVDGLVGPQTWATSWTAAVT